MKDLATSALFWAIRQHFPMLTDGEVETAINEMRRKNRRRSGA